MNERVIEALRRIETPGSFATRRTAGSKDLHIEVKGVGPIAFPVSRATARRLCSAARPATFGLEPARADDDWSMPAPSDCSCHLCRRLASFLQAAVPFLRGDTISWRKGLPRDRAGDDRQGKATLQRMGKAMKDPRIPNTDSIEELARFWDTHDLTDFEDQLMVIPKPVFEGEPGKRLGIH